MENSASTLNDEAEKKENDNKGNNDKNEIDIGNININQVIKEKITKEEKKRKKYEEEVKYYINLNVKTNEYNIISDENIDKIFNLITEERIIKW